jgi:hypothetical protein
MVLMLRKLVCYNYGYLYNYGYDYGMELKKLGIK